MGYFIIQSDGSRVYVEGNGKSADLVNDVTEAIALTDRDNGKVLVLKAAAGVAITLPDVSLKGFNCRIVTGLAFATTAWTIVSATNVIQGNVTVAGAAVAGSNENTISFVESAESLGDYVDIVSDGTNFYVSGSAVTAGAITLTVV